MGGFQLFFDKPRFAQSVCHGLVEQEGGPGVQPRLQRIEGEKGGNQHPRNLFSRHVLHVERGDEVVPKIRKISKDWEREVGITDMDVELRKRIKEIAINGMNLTEEL